MDDPEIIYNFYGVYLLYCINPKFKGRTYVGYTRDPNRRIMQHNRGTWAGGAHRTNNRGPWKMTLVVHGFPNNIAALRFEWAWQNPNKTTRLQHLELKRIPRKESEFKFKLRVLSEMLRVGPWCRLPLVVRWLENEYYEAFPPERKPLDHVIIRHGPIKCINTKKSKSFTTTPITECSICFKCLKDNDKITCVDDSCALAAHITCLADLFLPPGEYIPIEGSCPSCHRNLKWGDLIANMKKPSKSSCAAVEDVDSDDDVIEVSDVFVDNNSWCMDTEL